MVLGFGYSNGSNGYGVGYSDGSGSGDGVYSYGYTWNFSGNGSGLEQSQGVLSEFINALATAGEISAQWALSQENAEFKRMLLEAVGPDVLFQELATEIVHQDIDGVGNPRALLRIPMDEAEAGYLQAVRVVCPTTGRVYHLGVEPHVQTCQEAVASTFGLSAKDYKPTRES